MVLELESESMHGLLESESHEAQIGVVIEIKLLGKHTLESESLATGIGIRARISSTGIGNAISITGTEIIYSSGMYLASSKVLPPKRPEY